MPTQYTARAKLEYWQLDDRNWHVPYADTCAILDGLESVGALRVVPTESPSASLNVAVSGGRYAKADGTIGTYAGTGSFALTASVTNLLWLTDAGVLTRGTSWPAAFHVPLASVVAGTTSLTSVTDAHLAGASAGANGNTIYLALAGGTFADAGGVVTVGLGAANGTKIGATGDKLGFLGAVPVAQQAATVDLVVLLSTLGLRAAGGNPPLNLGTGAATCGALNIGGTTTLGDGQNVVAGTTTGTKFGTATAQKFGWWNAAPIGQPASANQAALGTLATVTLTDSTTGTAGTTVGDVGASFSQSTLNNINASFVAQLNHAVTDFASVKTLLNQLRADLVSAGILKGGA